MSGVVEVEYLVIGSGLAGLSFALRAARTGVVAVVTKSGLTESSTNYAQGGIAAVMSPDDAFDLHVTDTLEAGAGLCHEDIVRTVVAEGPRVIRELIDWGVRFTREGQGGEERLSLAREGGHSRHRVVRADDLTGREVEQALARALAAEPNVRTFERHLALDLIVSPSPRTCRGAAVLDVESGRVLRFLARATLLCTGGAGRAYLRTTNPPVATGDGIAMACRAGASVANPEFVQFHPTALHHPDAEAYLISEAVRGYGGVLVNRRGEPFVERHHAMGSLAPRDVVTRAIVEEMRQSGEPCVYLDVTRKDPEATRRHFPNIYRRCLSFGIDMTRQPIPVTPAAHYMCGGVRVDAWGRTDLDRLYASGETACTGLHGANRLASNSLLEAVAFSDRAFRHASERLQHDRDLPRPEISDLDAGDPPGGEERRRLSGLREEVRRRMWEDAGTLRSETGLASAGRRIADIAREVEALCGRARPDIDLIELRNLTTVARLIIRSALARRESRGVHHRVDFPHRDDVNGRKDTVLTPPL